MINEGKQQFITVTMTEGELRLFSEFLKEQTEGKESKLFSDENESPKLTKKDERIIWRYQRQVTPKHKDAYISLYDRKSNDEDYKRYITAKTKGGAGKGAILGGLTLSPGFAAAGALVGAGLSNLGARATAKGVQKIKESSPELAEKYQKKADYFKVADGRMTKDDFAKKYNSKSEGEKK